MTAWGVGPRLVAASLPAFGLAVVLQRGNPELFLMAASPHVALRIAGGALIVIGLLLWGSGVAVIDRAFREGRLLTTGAYSIVRHPMYCGWIVFITPGIALWFHSWTLLAAPVWAGVAFTWLIRDEERYLEEKFGQPYLDYKARVSAIVPFIRGSS